MNTDPGSNRERERESGREGEREGGREGGRKGGSNREGGREGGGGLEGGREGGGRRDGLPGRRVAGGRAWLRSVVVLPGCVRFVLPFGRSEGGALGFTPDSLDFDAPLVCPEERGVVSGDV
ncbi:hypothetical protein DPMN_176957 [Dreissena polymorpha]|uniref:Uncharacterized protein n=1 Tax=Dreissena polymorpha TaxID=45954 RepID=A0A9D4IK36_DREPO|nr:hypothetical protein DPMN_176957 [Dreissena polymorpha]